MKALLALIALTSALFGAAGALPLALEARLTALAPGGLVLGGLHYNPLTGHLTLRRVSAHDESGREIFSAEEVDATAPLADFFRGAPLTLQRVRVVAPRLVIAPTPALTLTGVSAGFAAVPVSVDGILVQDGNLIVEEPGRRAFIARDLTASADRLRGIGDSDAAFAVETVLYGTTVRITGQPLNGGAYALHVRARGLDAAALLEDFPQVLLPARIRLLQGRADIDATLVVVRSRVLASGRLRLGRLVVRFAEPRSAPFAASALIVAIDRWDVAAGTGRISRLELQRPTLTLDRGAPGAINTLVDRLSDPEVMLRRLRIVDGTVRLALGAELVTLRGLTLGLQSAAETGPRAGFVMTGHAGLGPGGHLTLDGSLSRDFRRAEGAVRAIGVTVQGCGLGDVSMPLPAEASPRAVLTALASVCGP